MISRETVTYSSEDAFESFRICFDRTPIKKKNEVIEALKDCGFSVVYLDSENEEVVFCLTAKQIDDLCY